MRRALVTLILATMAALAATGAGPAGASTTSDEARFVQLINEARAGAGVAPLTVVPSLTDIGRQHSADMSSADQLFHTANMGNVFPAGWQAIGENVGDGTGVGVDGLHQAFMNSPGHRDNILDSQFNYVGIGVVYAADGRLWVTEEFMKGADGLTAQASPAPSSEPAAVAGPASIPSTTWYFAEGYTGPGFTETLNILNPLPAPASITITYLLPGGATRTQSVTAGPTSRLSVDVNAAVGAGQEVSAVVASDSPVIAERALRFVYHGIWTGETTLIGSPAPQKAFYFAEGYTGAGFDEYVTLANPNGSAADAVLTYLFGDGTTQVDHVNLPAHSRSTVDVRTAAGEGRDVSTVVTADQPIMAERPMYFSYHGWDGGHISSGMATPATHLTFAEGYTGAGFDEFLTLLNPAGSPAHVTLTYLLGGGGTISQALTVSPHSRSTVKVNDVVADREVSVDLTSDQPVVAERPMYFLYKGAVSGGHDVVGSSAPAHHWLFPDGDTTDGTETYLTVANPQHHAVAFTVVFFDDHGATTTRNFSVPAMARTTVNVADAAGAGRVLGAQLSASEPVVAEQPTYSAPAGGGADVTGFPIA